MGVEELECRTQPAALAITGIIDSPVPVAPAGSSAASLVVLALPAGSVFTAPAESSTRIEFLFLSVPAASSAASQAGTGAAAAGAAPAPVAAANPVTVGTTNNPSQTTSSTTVIFVDIFPAVPIIRLDRGAESPSPVIVPTGPPTTGGDPGTVPVVPTNPFLPAGETTYVGIGQAAIQALPAVVYRGEYPTLVPVAPAPRAVPPADGAPQNDAVPADVAPPPRLVGRAEVAEVLAGQELVAAVSTATEDAPAAPAPAGETSSVWGWVVATTAVVATGYWLAYRHWHRKSLAARRAIVRFWQAGVLPTRRLHSRV